MRGEREGKLVNAWLLPRLGQEPGQCWRRNQVIDVDIGRARLVFRFVSKRRPNPNDLFNAASIRVNQVDRDRSNATDGKGQLRLPRAALYVQPNFERREQASCYVPRLRTPIALYVAGGLFTARYV